MLPSDLSVVADLLPATYLKQAKESRESYAALSRCLLANRRVPETPWPRQVIEIFMRELSLMDANNFIGASGVGEREGRCVSELVASRNFRLTHGVGRSGELLAEQPKAVGSSLLVKLTHILLSDILRNIVGLRLSGKDPVIVPCSTGMSLMLVFMALMRERPNARTVVWSRIDQKSCIKAMTALGLEVIVVEQRVRQRSGNGNFSRKCEWRVAEPEKNEQMAEPRDADENINSEIPSSRPSSAASTVQGDTVPDRLSPQLASEDPDYGLLGLEPDTEAFLAALNSRHPSQILCAFLTTSTFAPRAPDDVPAVAVACKNLEIPLVVNNAYGLQCSQCVHLIEAGMRLGRIDAVVQSTDKNFQVPVGGAIILGRLGSKVSALYPGRASASAVIDLFITFLEIGRVQLENSFKSRRVNFDWLEDQVAERVKRWGCRHIRVGRNKISLAIDLTGIALGEGDEQSSVDSEPLAVPNLTEIGSALFIRRVSGPRVVDCTDPETKKKIDYLEFSNFGAHNSTYPLSYLTAAVAVGVQKTELEVFLDKLEKIITKANRSN